MSESSQARNIINTYTEEYKNESIIVGAMAKKIITLKKEIAESELNNRLNNANLRFLAEMMKGNN